jgi:hypothetical protein
MLNDRNVTDHKPVAESRSKQRLWVTVPYTSPNLLPLKYYFQIIRLSPILLLEFTLTKNKKTFKKKSHVFQTRERTPL